MISISDSALKAQKDWERADQAEWQRQADILISQGYTCKGRQTRLPKFTKRNEATLILVRDLGRLNWHPQTF